MMEIRLKIYNVFALCQCYILIDFNYLINGLNFLNTGLISDGGQIHTCHPVS